MRFGVAQASLALLSPFTIFCIHGKHNNTSIIVRRLKKIKIINIRNLLEKDYSRKKEGTISTKSTDCLLNQIRFKCCCHGAKIRNILSAANNVANKNDNLRNRVI